MYYVLGIVLENDANKGLFYPSYILCKSLTTSEKRSGWRVIRQFNNPRTFSLPRVLVTSVFGHEEMIDFLSDFKTQDKYGGIHYHPVGYLCWFEANRYGEPNGSVYVVKKIPDEILISNKWRKRGFKRLKEFKDKVPTLKETLLKNRLDTEQKQTVKPKLHKYVKGEK